MPETTTDNREGKPRGGTVRHCINVKNIDLGEVAQIKHVAERQEDFQDYLVGKRHDWETGIQQLIRTNERTL